MWAQRQEDIYRLCIMVGLRNGRGMNAVKFEQIGVLIICARP